MIAKWFSRHAEVPRDLNEREMPTSKFGQNWPYPSYPPPPPQRKKKSIFGPPNIFHEKGSNRFSVSTKGEVIFGFKQNSLSGLCFHLEIFNFVSHASKEFHMNGLLRATFEILWFPACCPSCILGNFDNSAKRMSRHPKCRATRSYWQNIATIVFFSSEISFKLRW